ncbi:MAG: hypothetical protein NTX25_04595, partial [Proteobacteria bacterium]|nr:hypothetical protein [Pseudomonadota bacterium]
SKTGQKLDELLGLLNKDLWLNRILWEFADWWVEISINGLADNLHTRFYMYSEPLRILRSEKVIAIGYKERITKHPLFTPGAAADAAIKSIDEKIALIDGAISFIESRGWQGLLSLQKASAAKRASLLPGNKDCTDSVKLFMEGTATIKDVSSFDENSVLYRKSVAACRKKVGVQ